MKLYDMYVPVHETPEGEPSINDTIEKLGEMLEQYNIGYCMSLPTTEEMEATKQKTGKDLLYKLYYESEQNTEFTLIVSLFTRFYLKKDAQKILESINKSFGKEEKPAAVKRTPTGTNMTQERYADLEKHAEELAGHCDSSTVLTDAEAILLINKEFGFETARIEILHEAEIDVSEDGSSYVKTEKIPRKPVYAATDWNYIRFNVLTAPATWYYEMINAQLYPVLI